MNAALAAEGVLFPTPHPRPQKRPHNIHRFTAFQTIRSSLPVGPATIDTSNPDEENSATASGPKSQNARMPSGFRGSL